MPHVLVPKSGYVRGDRMRRYADSHVGATKRRIVLGVEHPAVQESTTIFRKSRRHPDDKKRLLVSGHNSAKIGAYAIKGRWRFPIYTLTLEERATCPTSCRQWLNCYGNRMPFAHRIEHGSALEDRLCAEVLELALKHPGGFIVRLHVLGDFYSVEYARLWNGLLRLVPQLHVYGYTAHRPESEIGHVIRAFPRYQTAIRFSNRPSTPYYPGTVTVETAADAPKAAIVCPAQTGGTDCCGTCALCWQTDRTIAFLEH